MKLDIVLGIVMIAIAFVVFPVVIDGSDEILSATNIANYTGLASVVKIAPLIVFVSMLFGGGFLTFRGVTTYRKTRKSKKSKNY